MLSRTDLGNANYSADDQAGKVGRCAEQLSDATVTLTLDNEAVRTSVAIVSSSPPAQFLSLLAHQGVSMITDFKVFR